jgi:hypothetical protein
MGNGSKTESVLHKALEVDSSYTEAHYVLGFLCTVGPSANPKVAKVHWQGVVGLEQGTERSQIAQVHLAQLEEDSAPLQNGERSLGCQKSSIASI